MEQLLTLGQFLNEKATREDLVQEQRLLYKNVFGQFDALNECLDEAMTLVDMGIFDGLVYEDLENDALYENLFKKAKEKLAAAKKTLADKGKKALSDTQEMILAIGGDIAKVIKMAVEAIAKACKEAFNMAAAAAKKAAEKSKAEIKKSIESMKDKNKLSEEIKNGKAMLGAMKAWVMGGFHKEAAKGMQTAAKQDEGFSQYAMELALYKSINEAVVSGDLDFTDLVNEAGGAKIPFISSIAAKLNKVPPFKQLYAVKNKVKDVVGNALEKFSIWATEVAGAPGPYKFVALATIIGIIVEMEVKGIGKKLLKVAFHAIPFAGTIISWAATVAKYLAYIAIIETLLAEVSGGEKDNPEAQTEK